MRYTNGQSLDYRRVSPLRTYRCTINHVIVCYDVLVPCGITGVRNFFEEQSIRRPVKLSLKQVCNADLRTDEEVHYELQPLQRDEMRIKLGAMEWSNQRCTHGRGRVVKEFETQIF